MGGAPCRRRCPFLVGDPAAEEWSPWSVCSLTCGQGLQVRTRSCVSSPYGTLCSGPLREIRPCNNSATCPGMPILPALSACRLRSCLGRGQVKLPKVIGCLLLFSKLDCPPCCAQPRPGHWGHRRIRPRPTLVGWFWAHHSPDVEAWQSSLSFYIPTLHISYILARPTPLIFSYLPAFPYSHPIPCTSIWAIKNLPVLQDLRQMPL